MPPYNPTERVKARLVVGAIVVLVALILKGVIEFLT